MAADGTKTARVVVSPALTLILEGQVLVGGGRDASSDRTVARPTRWCCSDSAGGAEVRPERARACAARALAKFCCGGTSLADLAGRTEFTMKSKAFVTFGLFVFAMCTQGCLLTSLLGGK